MREPPDGGDRRVRPPLVLILALQVISLLAVTSAPTSALLPRAFHPSQDPPLSSLVGTSMSDVVWSGHYLWVATERGLARWNPDDGTGLSAQNWRTYTQENGLGRGAVSALDAVGDTVWAATIFDTLIAGVTPPPQVGGGLSWSIDAGETWQYIPNDAIFDTLTPGFEDGPRTPVQNGCFGLSIVGDTVWAAFFSGSTVRTTDFGRRWERVLPGGGDQIVFLKTDKEEEVGLLRFEADSLASSGGDAMRIDSLRAAADSVATLHLLHRTFSVTAFGDTVWVGTSNGLTSSSDFGQTWVNHRVRLNEFGEPLPETPSGNWAVAVERQITQDGRSVIWAGTSTTIGPGQRNGISVSEDGGATWASTAPTFAWDFAFGPQDTVWAGTNDGLLVSLDAGDSWGEVLVEDPFTREQLRPPFIGVTHVPLSDGQNSIWSGADNGLGRSIDGGVTWTILSFPVKTPSLDVGEVIGEGGVVDAERVRTYAAPNPFAPERGDRDQCRIVYSLSEPSQVTIEIFDFASRQVRSLLDGADRDGERNHGENWDGLDDEGNPVANGVYFYRIATAAGDEAHGKIVVLD
jgi:hypothetical protein